MPGGWVPHRSRSHRLACLSLYRALLKQCSQFAAAFSGEKQTVNILKSLVKYRFQQDRKLKSPTQIVNGLQAGYKLSSLLESCIPFNNEGANFQSASLDKLTQIIISTSEQAESTAADRAHQTALWKPPPISLRPRLNHFQTVTTKANFTRQPESPHVLDRPLPLSQLKSGKRLVPHLVSTQGFPFLRYGKPQPIALSRMIRQRTQWTDKKWAQRRDMENQIIIAEMEDRWDNIVFQDFGIGDPEVRSRPKDLVISEYRLNRPDNQVRNGSWADALNYSINEIAAKLRQNDRKAADMGRKMWEIVLKEKELSRQEKLYAKLERKKKRQDVKHNADTI